MKAVYSTKMGKSCSK